MPFLSAISAGNLEIMRGTASVEPSHASALYVSLCPNTNVYTARINQSTFTTPLAQLTYDGGSGTLANVTVGMTVLISKSNDRTAAFFRGRVRLDPTASILYINETDGTQFDDDDYIFVIDDHALHEILARDVLGTLYPDWNLAFRTLKPLIYGLKSGYADWVTSDVYQISFAPTVVATNSGASISTYLWDVGDGTITVGAASDKNITATFPAGFRWISFTATDDEGESQIRYIPIWAHDPDTYPPQLLEIGEFVISATLQDGYNASLIAFDEVDAVLDNTLLCAWVDESYNGSKQHIDQNVVMVGRLRSESNRSEYGEDGNLDASVTFEVEGVIQQLARLRTSAMEIARADTPTAFNQVEDLTIWRAVHLMLSEYSTFSELHSLYFDDVATTFSYGTLTTAGQNIHATIIDLADSLNAVFQCSGTGECEFVRKAVYRSSGDRDALATVIDMTSTDILGSLGYEKQYNKPVGLIRADGGAYNTQTGETSAYLAAAPAGAPASGADETEIRRQVLQSGQSVANQQAELVTRVGNALAEAQQTDRIPITLPDGYWFLVPDAAAWYTLTLDGTELATELVLTSATRWVLASIDCVFSNETGTVDVSATLAKETLGEDGEIIHLPLVDNDEFPIVIGDLDEPIDIPSVIDNDIDVNPSDWVALIGSQSGDDWLPDCIGGGTEELLDLYLEFGTAYTLVGMSVTYTANYAGGADNQNQFMCRLENGDWVSLHTFTTQTGTGVTESATFANIIATAIRIILYAGGNDCTGSLTLTDATYSILEDDTYRQEWDFTASLFDWEIQTYSGQNTGSWVDGVGIKGVFAGSMGVDGAYRIWAKSPTVIDHNAYRIACVFSWDPDEQYYANHAMYGFKDGGSVKTWYYEVGYTVNIPPDGYIQADDSEVEIDQVNIAIGNIHLGAPTPSPGDVGELVLTKVIIWGNGPNPW